MVGVQASPAQRAQCYLVRLAVSLWCQCSMVGIVRLFLYNPCSLHNDRLSEIALSAADAAGGRPRLFEEGGLVEFSTPWAVQLSEDLQLLGAALESQRRRTSAS